MRMTLGDKKAGRRGLETRRPLVRRRATAWGALGASLVGALVMAVPAGKAGAANPGNSATSAQLAAAKKSLLVLSDMPKGWTSTKSSSDDSTIPGSAEMARCLGVPVSRITDTPPAANSREFDSKNGLLSVNDTIEVFPNAKAAQADLATGENKKAPQCLSANFNGASKATLQSQFGTGVTVGSIEVARNPASYYAPHTTNITLFLPVTKQGQTINLTISEVAFVKGQKEQTVTLTSAQLPFPVSLSQHLTGLAAARL
jgi:hypothetical protein